MKKEIINRLLYFISRLIVTPPILLLTILICLVFAILLSDVVALALFITALIVELIIWITWVAIGFKNAKEPLSSFTKRISIGICILYCVLAFAGYQAIFGNKCILTERSLCGKYTMKVYDTGGLFYMTAPGDGGNRPLKVVLKNRWGRTIGEEEEITNSLDTSWDYERNILWTSRGNGIYF